MTGSKNGAIIRRYTARFILACGLLFACDADAQPLSEVPDGIFIDLAPQPGWGPFIPRADYSAQHLAGEFSIQGVGYRVFLLRHDELGIEDRVLFQRSDADLEAAEGDGMAVFYRYEAIDLAGHQKFRQDRYPMPWLHTMVTSNEDQAVREKFELVGFPRPVLVDESKTIIGTDEELRGEKLLSVLNETFRDID